MNPFEMVAIIVVAVMIASVLRSRSSRRSERADPKEQAENLRLREEVGELKERLKVLERITVEKENSLARQIDELRDDR